MGCASGKNAGPRNIFGNKYGQNLAAVQIAREKRMEAKRQREEAEAAAAAAKNNGENLRNDDDDEASTDDDSDYGPTPVAGIWAGTQKLQDESDKIAGFDEDGEAETDDDSAEENDEDRGEREVDDDRATKKVRID